MLHDLDQLIKNIQEDIDIGIYEKALDSIKNFVQNIVLDERATGKVFDAPSLDNLCQQIGKSTLATLDLKNYKNLGFEENLSVYIATDLYKTGGHTAVIEDFIRLQPGRKHLILITDLFHSSAKSQISERFSTLPVEIEWIPSANSLGKLVCLQKRLVQLRPGSTFIFNHWQDSIIVAACQPSLSRQFFFYHHCDHQLSLGLHLPFSSHIDPHTFGLNHCRDKLAISNGIYVPLVAQEQRERIPSFLSVTREFWTTCSSGSAVKFEQDYPIRYAQVVGGLLKATRGRHVHFGPLSEDTIRQIQDCLTEEGLNSDQFVHVEWVASLWQAVCKYGVDLYISSFPVCGAKASVEVMGAGVPIAGHFNYTSRLLSGVDIIYPESFFWKHPDELYQYVASLTVENLEQQSQSARNHYETYHRPEICQEILANLLNGQAVKLPPSPPPRAYKQDELRIFLQDCREKDIIDKKRRQAEARAEQLQEQKNRLESLQVNTKIALHTAQVALHHTQTELHTARMTQHEVQTELHNAQSAIHTHQVEQYHTRVELHSTNVALHDANTSLHKVQTDLHATKVTLYSTQTSLQDSQRREEDLTERLEVANTLINAMESSKFWKLRNTWFKYKAMLVRKV